MYASWMKWQLYKPSQRQQQWPTALILFLPLFTVFPRSCLGIKKTRNKRSGGVEHVRFDINDSTNIKLVPLKSFLSHIDTKAKLTQYLGKALLVNFSDLEKNLIVVYGTSTYANYAGRYHPNRHNHQHEEADTLIPMHVVDA